MSAYVLRENTTVVLVGVLNRKMYEGWTRGEGLHGYISDAHFGDRGLVIAIGRGFSLWKEG